MRVHIILISGSFLLFAGGVRAQSRKFEISNINCRAVSCVASEGMQEGFTTLKISGRGFQREAGQSLVFVVVRHHGAAQAEPVLERKVGVFTDGHLTTDIAVYRLSDGVYDFNLHSIAAPSHFVAMGTFRRTTSAAQASRSIGQNALEPVSGAVSPESIGAMDELVGTWQGLNGTAGELRFNADGSYVLNGNSSGHVKRNGASLVFDGPLAAWDNGHATLKDGVIEFYWTGSTGAKNWFTFAKE